MLHPVTAALLLAGGATWAAPAAAVRADSVSAVFEVRVTVAGRTIVEQSGVRTIEVGKDDVARGWIDVPAGIHLTIRSNERDGYLLRFAPLSGPFVTGVVSWGTNLVRIDDEEETWIAQPSLLGTRTDVMHVRLMLRPDAGSGRYPLPVVAAQSR